MINLLSIAELTSKLRLSGQERRHCVQALQRFPVKIPRHCAELAMKSPILRKTVIPSPEEVVTYADDDMMNVHIDESRYQPVPGIIHRYPGKLLFLPTLKCFGHCRFCFRSEHRIETLSQEGINTAINYITENEDVRDVCLSGGDPLTLPIHMLDNILGRLRQIDPV